MDCFCGPTDARAFHRDWRRSGTATVELAGADVVRMAGNHLLAGSRTAGSVPDSVRRLWRGRRWLSLQISAAHGRALGADDAGGAREVPARHAHPLRLWSANRRNHGAGLMAADHYAVVASALSPALRSS